jgi:hypothetical protein
MGQLYTLTYTITNNTLAVMDLEVSIESSDGFVFSGNKYSFMRVLPLSSREVCLNVFPTKAGRSQLPKLRVTKKKLYGSRQSSVTDLRKMSSHNHMDPDLDLYYGVTGRPDSDIYVLVRP